MSKLKHLLWFLGGVVSVPALILGTAYGSWFMDLINVVDSL
jgi:hypothetical protein